MGKGDYGYTNSDGSGAYYGGDGSYGYRNSDGSGSYYGADGSYGYTNSDGSGSYYGADGSYGYRNSDGSGAFYGAPEESVNGSSENTDASTAIGLLIGLGIAGTINNRRKKIAEKRELEELKALLAEEPLNKNAQIKTEKKYRRRKKWRRRILILTIILLLVLYWGSR